MIQAWALLHSVLIKPPERSARNFGESGEYRARKRVMVVMPACSVSRYPSSSGDKARMNVLRLVLIKPPERSARNFGVSGENRACERVIVVLAGGGNN